MPRVKLDYVVSFSSEDSENQANNLLAYEVGKKKWLCSVGEPSCSIVLQLSRAVQIATVHIGACHAALVEVLVGRSEKPNDQFEVLVPSSVFLSPTDSRRDSGTDRVRSFTGEQLTPAKDKRWDRVRVVCSQPYNKHCKYGLSFIHIFEPEDRIQEPQPEVPEPVARAVPSRMMAMDNFSSDEDDFRPGELFAQHMKRVSDGPGSSGDTGAQIRQASSQVLKNIAGSSTKLVKTPITKTSTNRPNQSNSFNTSRQKETLMYTDDDELPHSKIDAIVQRHKDDKEQVSKKNEPPQPPKKDKKEANSSRKFKDFIDDKAERSKDLNNSRSKESSRDDRRNNKDEERTPPRKKLDDSAQKRDREIKKRPRSDEKQKTKEAVLSAGPVSSAPHTLLAGVTFALSGYENPRRARLRDAALAMGARFSRDWTPACTHLICAFPNTPKLKTVRAQGSACPAVLGEWLQQCAARRRLLPWQWFATEHHRKVTPPRTLDDALSASECDTDDEIEKVLRKQKRQRTDKSPSPSVNRDRSPRPWTTRDISPKQHTSRERSPEPHSSRERSPKPHSKRDVSPKPHSSREKSPRPHSSREKSPKPHSNREATPTSKKNSLNVSNMSSNSDVAFVKDERIQANITIDSDSDETDEEKHVIEERVDKSRVLPDFFEGYTFVIDERVEEAGFDVELLSRYVKAYGGVVVDASQLESDSEISYVLSTDSSRRPGSGQLVRADWVWRCHLDKALCDTAEYAL